MPGQEGRIAVVAGANSGLGKQAARVLALNGASVIISGQVAEDLWKLSESLTETPITA